MVVSLLEIDNKVTSLEFDEADLKEVSGAIVGQFGEIRILRKNPTYDEVEFGDEHTPFLPVERQNRTSGMPQSRLRKPVARPGDFHLPFPVRQKLRYDKPIFRGAGFSSV